MEWKTKDELPTTYCLVILKFNKPFGDQMPEDEQDPSYYCIELKEDGDGDNHEYEIFNQCDCWCYLDELIDLKDQIDFFQEQCDLATQSMNVFEKVAMKKQERAQSYESLLRECLDMLEIKKDLTNGDYQIKINELIDKISNIVNTKGNNDENNQRASLEK